MADISNLERAFKYSVRDVTPLGLVNESDPHGPLVIEHDFRTITIPENRTLLGVTSDENVNIVPFVCPRYYGPTDLSEFDFRINYQNANGEGDAYAVLDKEVQDDETITFTWVVGRHACAYVGNVRFIVCARIADNQGIITKEYNTAVHSLPVIQGLETDAQIEEDNYDLIEEFLQNIEAAPQVAEDAAEVAVNKLVVEGMTYGTQDGEPVDSSSEYYHNNSVYYNGLVAGAGANALKAEGFAVGEQNGSAVQSGSPYYHNNAEYFAGQASGSADLAASKASEVADKVLVSDTEPSASGNLVWVKSTPGTVQVPTYAEFSDVKSALNAVENENAVPIPFTLSSGFIKYADGTVSSDNTLSHTDYIDVSKYSYIRFKVIGLTNSSASSGMVFYDSGKNYISGSGVQSVAKQAATGYLREVTVEVPETAVYARFSAFTNTTTYGNFEVYWIPKIVADVNDKIGKKELDAETIKTINLYDSSIASVIDSTEAYEKTVPENSMSYAVIKSIQGNCVKENSAVSVADVRSVKSIGVDGTTVIDLVDLDVLRYFPNGMYSARSIYDELSETKAIRRIGVVDLGSLTWSKYTSYSYPYYRANFTNGKSVGASDLANVLCANYDPITVYSMRTSATAKGVSIQDGAICIRDNDYSTADALKTALNGVLLYYELTAYEETNVEPIRSNVVKVQSGGMLQFTNYSGSEVPVYSKVNFLLPEKTAINNAYHPMPSARLQNGINDFTIGYKFNDSGKAVTDSDCVISNDYFYAEENDVLLMLYVLNINKYTVSKTYVANVNVHSIPLYSGQERWNAWVVPATGYYRFTFAKTTYGYGVTRLEADPFEIVCLGDSIFGNNQPPYDLPTYIEVKTGKKTANCAFGGTEAGIWDAEHDPNMSFMEKYNPLSYCGIADAIYSDDWTDIDVDWYTLYGDWAFMPNKYLLVNKVDFSKVKMITVAFGANDWAHKRTIDNQEDLMDRETFKGALRYGTEKILSAYPNVTIVFLSPIWSYAYTGETDYTKNTDNTPNGDGVYITDYITAMKEVAEEYHLPFFDNYTYGIINALNGRNMIRDKSHLNTGYGVDRMGRLIGSEIASVFDFIPNYENGNIT